MCPLGVWGGGEAFADGTQTQTVRGERGSEMGEGRAEWGQLTGLDHSLSLCRRPGGDVGQGPGRLELERRAASENKTHFRMEKQTTTTTTVTASHNEAV